ncbi:MAG: SDR family NAD(P)-dependent oxidoreductase [Sulfurospirillum sp.]|nr:SDR family NAD(P)-dependent oxidoreductase [Sulfurospirillum sp.]
MKRWQQKCDAQKRIWIIGGSSGIGLCLVSLWLQQGFFVAVSSRNACKNEALSALASQYPNKIFCVDVDVSNQADLQKASDSVWQLWGGIDWCMYNAGAYEVMRFDRWNSEAFVRMNETNYMGAVRFSTLVAPKMRLAFGIQVQVINHGFVKTRLTAKNNFAMPQLMSPEVAAQYIFDALVRSYRFELYFPFALRTFLRFLSIIPNTLALKITKKML